MTTLATLQSLIAEAFHRTGAVEVWGRGTNRVIEECQRYGIESPTFEADAGFVVVTFRAQVAPAAAKVSHVGTKLALSRHQVQLLEFARGPRSLAEFMRLIGRTDRTKFRDQVLRPLLEAGLIEMTIPDKPRSSLQRYRTTAAGEEILVNEKP
jgi:ATP-dependent DNA helicase RecG